MGTNLTFEKTFLCFELKVDLPEMITDHLFWKNSARDESDLYRFSKKTEFQSNSVAGRKKTRTVEINYRRNKGTLRKLRKDHFTSAPGIVRFLSENPKDICDKIRLTTKNQIGGNGLKRFDVVNSTEIGKLLEILCNTTTEKKLRSILINIKV